MISTRVRLVPMAASLVLLLAACGAAAGTAPVSAGGGSSAAATVVPSAVASVPAGSASPAATPPATGTIGNYCYYWHQITAAPWGDWLTDPLKPGPGGSLPVVTFGPVMSADINPNPAAADVQDAWNTIIYLGYQNQIDPSQPAITPGADYAAAVQKIEAFNTARCP